jgi:hypothetical protein
VEALEVFLVFVGRDPTAADPFTDPLGWRAPFARDRDRPLIVERDEEKDRGDPERLGEGQDLLEHHLPRPIPALLDLRDRPAGVGLIESTRELDLEVRAGIHTGECQVIGDKSPGSR